VSVAAIHTELNEIERRHGGCPAVDGRVRKARHGLRIIAGGDETVITLTALLELVADLHRVTRGGV
jgi:hypothetical protein